ncbi:hypothetical protein ACVWZZ_005519 [Bradyrhizobium sp. LM6.10]
MNEPDTEFALESERSLMPQKKQHIDLSDPNLSSLILRLAIPSVVGLSIHALQQVVNAIFVGALGAQATAAVSMTFRRSSSCSRQPDREPVLERRPSYLVIWAPVST